MKSVAVIDYGMGNLHSVAKALERVAEGTTRVVVSHDPALILRADRVVLPGVGAIRDCMHEIKRLGMDEVVREVVKTKPLLGVCVGMQALLEFSAENGGTECLGVLPGRAAFFGNVLRDFAEHLKVPHMGWNQVHQTGDHPMWRGIGQDSRFYFVHSYFLPGTSAITAGSTEYGVVFTSAVTQDNVFATQFHPEKSAAAGLRLYANFLEWDGAA
ncbi:MAG: imidazole glycerol phosphate synthase subunit HisH [Pseudomonadota bacterium]